MTTLIGEVRARTVASSHAGYFYFYMALSCMAVAFLGFAPTYWLPMATRSLPSMPVIHFHGMLFFAWTLYFAFQTWLAASGRIARHRTIGMIGVSLATAMTIFGFLAAVNIMKRSAALGLTDAGVAFAIVPLSGILFFADLPKGLRCRPAHLRRRIGKQPGEGAHGGLRPRTNTGQGVCSKLAGFSIFV